MSSPNFYDMKEEDLQKYLKNCGMNDDDVKVIRKGKYNGKTIFLLEDSKELSKFSEASKLLLEKKVFAYKDIFDGPTAEEQEKEEMKWKIDETTDHVKFKLHGLGCAVDASNPSPLSYSSKLVITRTIHPELKNLNEHWKKERHRYMETISSLNMHRSSVTASVSDLVGKVLTLQSEAEYKRENSKERITSGEKEITRSMSFKSFHHSYQDSDFEEKFCRYLIPRIPEIECAAGTTLEEKLNNYIRDSHDHFQEVLEHAYNYIKQEKITHYINKIELGAAVYSIGVSKSKVNNKKMEGKAGVDILAEAGAAAESKIEKFYKNQRDLTIGDFDSLKDGTGEGVLAYHLMPLFTLMNSEHTDTKKVLQQAIRFYLDRERGPFTISFMHKDRTMYWKVDSDRVKKTLVGTTNRDNAAIFYIEMHSRPEEFMISHFGETMKKTRPSNNMFTYVSASSKINRHVGPLLVEGPATKFILRHPAIKKVPVKEWGEKGCYIKLAPRKTQKKSYIAFDTDGDISESMCVESPEIAAKNNLAVRFSLTRVAINTVSSLFAAPSGKSINSYDRLCSDSSNPDVSTGARVCADSAESGDTIQQFERLDSDLFQGTETTSTENQNETVSPQFSLEIQTAPEGDETSEDEFLTDEDLDYNDSDVDDANTATLTTITLEL